MLYLSGLRGAVEWRYTARMTDTTDSTETRPPLADMLADGPVRADPPRRSPRAGVWVDKLRPLIEKPNEWFLVEQFSRPNQAENAATNLRRPTANKPPLPEGWSWEFSSASFPAPNGQGHSSLYAKVTAPGVKVEPTAPVVREERPPKECTARIKVPATDMAVPVSVADPPVPEPDITPTPEELAEMSGGEPDDADLPVQPDQPVPSDTAVLPEPDYESLKAENDTTALTLDNLDKVLAAASEPTDDEIPF